MAEGWISIHRKILENPIICKDSDYFSVWCYLLLNATHDKYDTIFKSKRITLVAGQLITGRQSIALKFGITESKVQRILKTFEIEQQIEQQTSTQNRLITIVNWGLYQNSEQQNERRVNNKRTTNEQQMNTNNNVNNVNNENNVNNGIKESIDPAPTSPNPKKNKFGEYGHILLTEIELEKLKTTYPNTDELIKHLDEYIEMKGTKYKSHYLAILRWVVNAVEDQKTKSRSKQATTRAETAGNPFTELRKEMGFL